MKKFFLALIPFASILCMVGMLNVSAANSSTSVSTSVCATSNFRKVTVYEIQVPRPGFEETIKRTLSGLYNPDDNTISIRGKIRSVQKNTYTGEGRENYEYQASGIFFFNL